jgi:hypothetical protein
VRRTAFHSKGAGIEVADANGTPIRLDDTKTINTSRAAGYPIGLRAVLHAEPGIRGSAGAFRALPQCPCWRPSQKALVDCRAGSAQRYLPWLEQVGQISRRY